VAVYFINKHTRSPVFTLLILFLIFASSLLFSSCFAEDAVSDSEEEYEAQEEEAPPEGPVNDSKIDSNREAKHQNCDPEEICKNLEYLDDFELPRIGLYSGKGSWNDNVEVIGHFLEAYDFTWSGFDEHDAVNLDLEAHFDLLWFPGGFAAEYKNYINDHSKIKAFIDQGGLFIGSCAGAYYASDILRWQGTDYEYPLKLFDGKGIGPLAGLIGWGETGTIVLEEDHPANHNFNLEKEIYYFDGPYFEPYDQEAITVLARYEINNQPAVIAGDSGQGKFLLLGPHPEIGGYSEQAPHFSLDGEEGAQWPWLYQLILWFTQH